MKDLLIIGGVAFVVYQIINHLPPAAPPNSVVIAGTLPIAMMAATLPPATTAPAATAPGGTQTTVYGGGSDGGPLVPVHGPRDNPWLPAPEVPGWYWQMTGYSY